MKLWNKSLHWFPHTKNFLKISVRQIKKLSDTFSGFSKMRSSRHLDCWILPWVFLSWVCQLDDLIQYSELVIQGDRLGLNILCIWEVDIFFTLVKLLFALCYKLLWLWLQPCLCGLKIVEWGDADLVNFQIQMHYVFFLIIHAKSPFILWLNLKQKFFMIQKLLVLLFLFSSLESFPKANSYWFPAMCQAFTGWRKFRNDEDP